MMECLYASGNTPVERDKLKILVITGIKICEHFFNNEVGIGSRSQYLSGEEDRILVTSFSVTGRNAPRQAG